MEATSATEMLRRLSPAEIRERLESLSAEEKALRTLLRAALDMERRNPADVRLKPQRGRR